MQEIKLETPARNTKPGHFALLAHPFRIFFLAAAVYSVLVVFAWIAFLLGGWPLPLSWSPPHWHSHEMLYGFVVAAIAGFMLTALTNWTGAAPLQGKALLALFLLWLAGRIVMNFAEWISPWLVALTDLSFLAVLIVYVFYTLWKFKNYRNMILLVVLSFLLIGNLSMHIGFIAGDMAWLQRGHLMGFDLISLLIAIIAGRITPAFSKNWLHSKQKNSSAIRKWPMLEVACLVSLALLMLADGFSLSTESTGYLALVAAVLHSVRLYGWAGWLTWREPLLWILHLAYCWLIIALALRGLSAIIELDNPSVWQHALGVGAIGTIILGVMTRVSMGHTGRTLGLLKGAIAIYLFINLAALLRIMVALDVFDFRIGVSLSALAWILAYGLFAILYGPILMSPRVDGKAG